MNAQLTEYQHQRQLDNLTAHMRELVERAHAKGEREGRRQGFAMLESSCKSAKQEGREEAAAEGKVAEFVSWLHGVCMGILIALLAGPVVAGWLT